MGHSSVFVDSIMLIIVVDFCPNTIMFTTLAFIFRASNFFLSLASVSTRTAASNDGNSFSNAGSNALVIPSIPSAAFSCISYLGKFLAVPSNSTLVHFTSLPDIFARFEFSNFKLRILDSTGYRRPCTSQTKLFVT